MNANPNRLQIPDFPQPANAQGSERNAAYNRKQIQGNPLHANVLRSKRNVDSNRQQIQEFQLHTNEKARKHKIPTGSKYNNSNSMQIYKKIHTKIKFKQVANARIPNACKCVKK